MILLQILVIVTVINSAICTIHGLNYMDALNFRSTQEKWQGEGNPCNPLYWYPREVPEYCYHTTPKPDSGQPRLPIPVPLPHVPLFPDPIPPLPLPYGVPIVPSNPMLPIAGIPYLGPPASFPFQPYHRGNQVGMVPGLPGLVTRDEGINILPFSDVYADLLEKQKKKMLTKRLRHLFEEYDDYPWHRRNRIKKYKTRFDR